MCFELSWVLRVIDAIGNKKNGMFYAGGSGSQP